MSEFHAPQNQYLVFEDGPSVDVTLQWATYRDASDQCSLSRIWGGIHPPIDDIPGRLIGMKIGPRAFDLAEHYFNGTVVGVPPAPRAGPALSVSVYPNPVMPGKPLTVGVAADAPSVSVELFSVTGQRLQAAQGRGGRSFSLNTGALKPGVYMVRVKTAAGESSRRSARDRVANRGRESGRLETSGRPETFSERARTQSDGGAARTAIRASTTSQPCPGGMTLSGFRSISTISGWSPISCETRSSACSSAAMSPGGAPR